MTTLIPSAALDQHGIALGKTRSGKSSKLRLLVEGLLDNGEPVCILDPKGDWWGIKSSNTGKSAGYPVVIFGGEHADVPLNEHSGAAVAELVATGNRPALIDLGGWMVAPRTRFFIDFASTLFKLTRGKRFLVIDECHNFVPKGKIFDPEAGKMLHWGNRLASEGQGKGLILLAGSQRPQKVHNDFLTSCETLIACRVTHKADRDAIKDWIDGCADAAKGREVLDTLAKMPRTDAWVWSPEIDFGPERVTFPMFKTYDSFKPQAAGAAKLKGWAEIDLEDVKAKLTAVVEEAKSNDPKELKAQLATANAKLKKLEGDKTSIDLISNEAKNKFEFLIRENLERHYKKQFDEFVASSNRGMGEWMKGVRELAKIYRETVGAITFTIPIPPGLEAPKLIAPSPAAITPPRAKFVETAGTAKTALDVQRTEAPEKPLGRCERLILSFLATNPGRFWKLEQVAIMTKYAVGGGGFGNAISKLGGLGLIGRENGSIALRALPEGFQPERIEYSVDGIREILGRCEREIVRVLLKDPSVTYDIDTLAGECIQASGQPYSAGGGGFGNALGKLSSLGFIDRRMGRVEVSEAVKELIDKV